MNYPSDYRVANEAQRHDAQEIIAEYFSRIKWRTDCKDALIDIGSGTGDVLFDFLYPLLSSNFERIVCTDVNPKMVESAKKFYSHYKKSDFLVLNIGSDIELPVTLKEQFDHVTSFYCLHWVRDQRQALKNIYNLLSPHGGDCLLVLLVSVPVYDVYYSMTQMKKWSKFMKNIECFISPLNKSPDPEMELCSMLESIEFSNYDVKINEKTYIYKNLQIFKDNMKALNPFLDQIPSHLCQEFMDDFIAAAIKLNLAQPINNGEDYSFHIPYKQAVVYAEKSSNISRLISYFQGLSTKKKHSN